MPCLFFRPRWVKYSYDESVARGLAYYRSPGAGGRGVQALEEGGACERCGYPEDEHRELATYLAGLPEDVWYDEDPTSK